MPRKKKQSSTLSTNLGPLLKVDLSTADSGCPDFLELLRHPLVDLELPRDFKREDEGEHLRGLWNNSPSLRAYKFESFVHAGGSGMVFKVFAADNPQTPVRVFAERELHELIIRYLEPRDVQEVTESVIPILKMQK